MASQQGPLQGRGRARGGAQAPASDVAAVKRAARQQGKPQRAQVARLAAVLLGAALALVVAAVGGRALMRAFVSDADVSAGASAEAGGTDRADGDSASFAFDVPADADAGDSCAEPVVFTQSGDRSESAAITVWGAYACRFERTAAGSWAFTAQQEGSNTVRTLFELTGEPVGFALRKSVFYVVQNLPAGAGGVGAPCVEVVTCTIADGATPTSYLRQEGTATGLELQGDELRIACAEGDGIVVDLPAA